MTRTVHAAEAAVDPRLARTLWQGLAVAALAVALIPTLRGPGHVPGLGSAWLLLAPALALLVAHRGVLRARLAPAFERGRAVGAGGSLPAPAAPATAHRRRPAGGRAQAPRPATPRRGRHLRVA